MARHLPSLNGLKAFEAAARHLSFTRAADELNVTQAAISHQVKSLEERVGVALFRRMNRSLLLTDEGQALFPAVSEGLDLMAGAVDRLKTHNQTNVLTVSTLDSIAASWLVPRLGKFRRLHPEIEIRISTADQIVDFVGDGIDMAIRYGYGDYPGTDCVLLMTETLYPVLSPSLRDRLGPLLHASDLKRFPLLHDDIRDDWHAWMELAGEEGIDVTRGPSYSHSNLVIQAAVAGEGVALGRSVLVADNLEAGLLVKPFDIELKAMLSYFAVCPKAAANRPKIAAFRTWLQQEAAETHARSLKFSGPIPPVQKGS